jgi:hypothetical protein
MTTEQDSWFTFSIQDTGGAGIEVPKLARLLEDMASAFYAAARARLGPGVARPGPRTAAEDALAGVRLLRVSPGSAVIELIPPPSVEQLGLQIDEQPSADDVALDLFEEIDRVRSGEPSPADRVDVTRRVRSFLDAAGQIGGQANVVFRPRASRDGRDVFQSTISIRDLPTTVATEPTLRRRRYSGHAYMVDIEPGRQRLRIKMPDGRDVTLNVDQTLIDKIGSALDQVVEVDAEEQLEGSGVLTRFVRSVNVLPSAGPGSDKPPKSVQELAREQGLPSSRPDYSGIASDIWATEDDVAEFEAYLRTLRRAEAS